MSTSVITEGQIALVLSGGAANANVINSVGGPPSNTEVISTQINDVWMNITTPTLTPGITLYRELYIRNINTTTQWVNIKAWFSKPMTVSGAVIYLAKSTKPPFTDVVSGSDTQQTSDAIEPPGVTWVNPNSQSAGLIFGPIPPGGFQGIWLKLVVGPDAFPAPDECYTLRIQGDNKEGATQPGGKVQFGGGPLLQHANLYFIFWGSSYNVSGSADNSFMASIISAIQKLDASIYFSKLSQYSSIGPPTYKASVVNTVTAIPPSTFSEQDCRQVCIDSINAGQVPQPNTDVQLLYVVVAPSGKDTSEASGAATGEHGNFSYQASGSSVVQTGVFAWIKNLTQVVDDATAPMSHEIVEAITDPDVEISNQAGFFIADNVLCGTSLGVNCEISDPCVTIKDRVNDVNVEAYWSDADNSCVIPGAGGAPPPPGGTGPDGVKQLFTPNTSGASFFLGDLNPNTVDHFDTEGDSMTAGSAANVSFWTISGHAVHYSSGATGRTVRLNISATGSQQFNWKTGAISKGYIASPGDFKNCESTIIIRGHSNLHIHTSASWKILGGIHTGSHDPRASTPEMDVPYQPEHKTPQFARELNHPDYDYVSLNPNFTAYIVADTWIGIKCVAWKNKDGVSQTMRIYLNMTPWNSDGTVNNANWQFYSEYIDKQGVNTGSYTQFVSWAGGAPHTMRIDGWDSVDFAKLSVFEIINPGT